MFMLSLFGSMGKASAKLIATFVLVIILMVLAFAFAPGLIRELQDHIEVINDMVRTPVLLDNQGLILYRTLVNENTIFGIIMTLIARAIIEIVAWLFGQAFQKEED